MKITQWFPADIKPVYKGLYDVKLDETYHTKLYWNGQRWCFSLKPPHTPMCVQNREWRGLVK